MIQSVVGQATTILPEILVMIDSSEVPVTISFTVEQEMISWTVELETISPAFQAIGLNMR